MKNFPDPEQDKIPIHNNKTWIVSTVRPTQGLITPMTDIDVEMFVIFGISFDIQLDEFEQ